MSKKTFWIICLLIPCTLLVLVFIVMQNQDANPSKSKLETKSATVEKQVKPITAELNPYFSLPGRKNEIILGE